MDSLNVFELFASIRLDTSEYENSLTHAKSKFDAFGENLSKAGESLSKTGSTLTKAVTLPIVGLGTAIVKTGMDYEAGMSKVQAISGATGDEMTALGEKAMEMAAKTKFSTADSAEAYQYMAMAGWKAGDMIDGLAGIMNLAAASGENLGTTSDIVTDAITAFGLSAADSGRFADVLAAASNNANTNVSMLGESFKYVAPVAGALGYSIEDTSIALGLMANSGIKASQAGTALRTLLTNMAKPTDTMAIAMEKLGVSLTDDEGNMYSLMGVMEQLRGSFGGGSMSAEDFSARLAELNEQLSSGSVTQEEYDAALERLMMSMYGVEAAQKAELAAMLAGKEGMSGLLAIVNASEKDFNDLTTAIYNSKDTAEEMARIMQDNAAGAFERMKSAVNVLFTQLSTHLLPIFTSVVEKITEWVNWFGQLDEGMQKVILTIAAVVAGLGPVLVIIGKVITAVGTIISTVSKIGPLLSAVKAAASGLFAVLAANPITLVVAAVAALIAVFVALWNNCEGFRNFWIGLWDGIVNIAKSAANMFGGIGKSIVDGIKNGISNAWKGLKDFVGGLFDGLVGGVKSLLGIHSPSKVFAGIGGNMALGLGEGWEDEYSDIRREIENGLSFSVGNVGIAAIGACNTAGMVQSAPQAAFSGSGNTYVTINSPVAVDAVQAAREWKKTTQRMAIGYV